jgi:hypothetical protein
MDQINRRPVDLVQHGLADDRVVANRLCAEETRVGGEADLPQSGQVTQPLADPEIIGVVLWWSRSER